MDLQEIWKMMSDKRLTLVALALAMLISIAVNAQVSGGAISGVVSDSSRAVIPNVQISIRNVATGVSRDVTSDGAGFYMAPNLLPGAYEVTATAQGFSTLTQSGIQLTVGAQQVLNITMQVGQITQKIDVTEETPEIQLGTSTLSDIVDSTTVRELPLNGRDWTELAILQPGVVSVASIQSGITNGFQRGQRGFGALLIISGAKGQQTSYRVDGININDYIGGGPGSVFGASLGVDAIQEFSVLTSDYSTEYGRASGGVVNAVTRSGTNSFHGDAYEFLRNSGLDARNFFDGATIPPFRRNQFGASAGGPIKQGRTFFFVDYEGLRQSLGSTSVDHVPSPNARNGILNFASPADFPTGCVATLVANQCQLTVDPVVQKALALWSPANGPILAPGNTAVFSFAGNQIISENIVTARVDHKISDKDSVFSTFQFDRAPLTLPDSLDDTLIGSKTERVLAAVEETHIFNPELVNSFRVGLNRNSAINADAVSAINPEAADTALTAVPEVPGIGAPLIIVPGLTQFPGGLNAATSSRFLINSFQEYDDLFFTKGIHSLKFGFSAERDQQNEQENSGIGGKFQYGTLADFLTNQPALAYSGDLSSELSGRALRQSIFGAYVQDDIRFRPNLTFNLGIRYEMATSPTEVNGKLSALTSLTSPVRHLGSPLFNNPTLRNFEPRVGFAWDPFRNGKTSVRGGFGIFDVLPLLYEYQSKEMNVTPFIIAGSTTTLPSGSFPSGAQAILNNNLATGTLQGQAIYIQPNPKRNYVMQWNLSGQRELMPNLTALVAYVGSHAVHGVTQMDDTNIVLPTLTSAGYLWPSPVGSGTVQNPAVGRMYYLDWGSNASYNALDVQIVKRMSHGLQIQGSYTWGKSIDESSSTTTSDPYLNSVTDMLFFDPKSRRALSDFNVAQNLVINYIWDIPSPKSLQGLAERAVSGWQLGGVWTIQSGLPFTPLLAGDPLGENSTDPIDFPDRLYTGSGCKTATNPGNVNNYINLSCFTFPTAPSMAFYTANCDPVLPFPQCSNLRGNSGRNSLIGPGMVNFDFSLFKNNYIRKISESFNVQFRAEVFNAFNHPNFVSPIDNSAIIDQTGATIGGAGAIDTTSTTAREIQFALKVIW